MGLFSGMKQSMAAAKDALKAAEEQARNAAAGSARSSQQPDVSMGVGSAQANWPPTSTPIPAAGPALAEPLQSWATAGANTPYVSPQPTQFVPPPTSNSSAYPGSAFGGGYPTAPASSSPTQAMIAEQMREASSPPPPGKRRWWPTIALVLAIGGGIVLAIGIIALVRHNSEIRSSAVVNGDVGRADASAATYQFTVDEPGALSVYIDVDIDEENARDAVIRATECTAAFEDGSTASIRGSRQASSSTIGDLSSIGYFDAPAGRAAIRCIQEPFREAAPFYVSPGTTNNFAAMGLTLGGAGLLAIAMVVAIRGLINKQRVRVQRVR